MQNSPAASADRESAVSLGCWKGKVTNTELPNIAACDISLGIDGIDSPSVMKQRIAGRDGSRVRAASNGGQFLGRYGELVSGSLGINS